MVGIVGGGIIGLSIAWRLAQRGFKVMVFNAGNRGGEASAAGAGMLAPGGEFVGRSVWADLAQESLALYPAFVEELAAESGRAIDFHICGAIELGVSAERIQKQAAQGIVCCETSEGVFYPNDGYVDPRDVLASLRLACNRRGVEIQDRTMVGEIDADRFEALIVAAGAWSGDLAVKSGGKQLRLPRTIPVKGHLLGYQIEAGRLGPIRRRGHTYLLQRANGFTIAGSNEERIGFRTHVDPDICHDIHTRAVELWAELAKHAPSECWIGFRPATEDLLPRIERFEQTNVWLAYGHYRNGILLAPVTAQRIAAGITSSLGRD